MSDSQWELAIVAARQAVIDAAYEWLDVEYGDAREFEVDAELRDALYELDFLENK